jgi:ABC-type nickel/cobalt efflux system permease component RcnA
VREEVIYTGVQRELLVVVCNVLVAIVGSGGYCYRAACRRTYVSYTHIYTYIHARSGDSSDRGDSFAMSHTHTHTHTHARARTHTHTHTHTPHTQK